MWGTSLGATHVPLAAARHPELAAAVVRCPVIATRDAAASSGVRAAAWPVGPIIDDLVRSSPRRCVGIVDEPGRAATVTVSGAGEGWNSMLPPGVDFDNRVAASVGFDLIRLSAAGKAPEIDPPLLVCVSDRETLTDPRIAARAANRAPRGIAVRYPADHFSAYHSPLVEQVIADQGAFLVEHLAPPTRATGA